MEHPPHNKKKTSEELRKFGLTLGSALIVLGALLWLIGRDRSPGLCALAGALLVALGYGAPRALAPVERAWMKLGLLLGGVVTRVLLVVFFFLVVTPVAVIARLTGKRFLELGFRDPRLATYWEKRSAKEENSSGLEKQF